MRVVFAGTPSAALPALDALLDSRHEVLAVVTRPDAAAGRGRQVGESPVAQRSREAGVEVLKPAKPGDPDLLARLEELAPECCPVVAYGALLPAKLLELPPYGWVNLHFSLLPAWRGAAPVQHALLAGDEITGATTFRIVPELDAGPVLASYTEPIRPTDTAGKLLDRLATSGARLLMETLDGLEQHRLRAVPQPKEGWSLAPKLTVADARIDWSGPAFAVDRRIRACTPTPGAWTTFRGQRLKLHGVDLAPTAAPEPPGLPAGHLRVHEGRVLVGTGTTPVGLVDVQPAGKRVMPAGDWARGARIRPGEALGVPAS
jgi:methionyl-tRNA formyltransferase